jgi:hypothetical protein
MLYTKNTNLDFPVAGVGLGLSINSPISYQQNLLNLWRQQCLKDGAKSASFEQKINPENNNVYFETKVNYGV